MNTATTGTIGESVIIRTDEGNKDGQNKCPKCGATDISLNAQNGLLRCNFCRHEFEPEKPIGIEPDLSQLKGHIIGSGATDIIADTNDVLTFKCSSCGAEVVIDTSQAAQARCHWCRNTLSVNQQISNGSIPDMVLPFNMTREAAKAEIEKFVEKRKFFAYPKFKEEFTTQNVMGVYFPYMVVDVNSHAKLTGQGERLVRRYTRGSGNNQKTYYDADLYDVEREFDLMIDDLTIESSSDKLQNSANSTNNIINAVMPFDTENSLKWDANYLKGYTSEKRDTNIEHLRGIVDIQSKDIARHRANETLGEYNRGVCWSSEKLDVKGQSWKAAYLPIWLYSYRQMKSGGNNLLHYVAVNARTKETTGSVPIHTPKLLLFSLIAQIVGIIGALIVGQILYVMDIDSEISLLLLLSGVAFFIFNYLKYRNAHKRHKHEHNTRALMDNIQGSDKLVKRLTGLRNARMNGANNLSVGSNRSAVGSSLMDMLPDSVKNHIE